MEDATCFSPFNVVCRTLLTFILPHGQDLNYFYLAAIRVIMTRCFTSVVQLFDHPVSE